VARRPAAEFPDPARARDTVASRQVREVLVGLLHQQRGTRGRAPASDPLRFDERYANTRVGKPPGERRAGDAAADNRHVDADVTAKRRVPRRGDVRAAREPERATQAKSCHADRSLAGTLLQVNP